MASLTRSLDLKLTTLKAEYLPLLMMRKLGLEAQQTQQLIIHVPGKQVCTVQQAGIMALHTSTLLLYLFHVPMAMAYVIHA